MLHFMNSNWVQMITTVNEELQIEMLLRALQANNAKLSTYIDAKCKYIMRNRNNRHVLK